MSIVVLLLPAARLPAQIREYRIHDRGMLHETVYNTGEIGRAWMTGEAGNKTAVPVFEWPARSYTIVDGIEYSGQHNILGAGVYIAANEDGVPGLADRLFAFCGGVGASTPEITFGLSSFPLYMTETENFPVLDDGSLNPDYDPDEAEEIIETAWASSVGITVKRTSRAWSYPDYDDMIIYEYEFEYTGDTDGNPATIERTTTLKDVHFNFIYGFAPSMYGYQRHYQEWKYESGIYRGDQNNHWDGDYWLSFNLNLRTAQNANVAAKPEPNKELFLEYAESGKNGGGLTSPQAPGYVVLHYDTTHLAKVIPTDSSFAVGNFDNYTVYGPDDLAQLPENESESQSILRNVALHLQTKVTPVPTDSVQWYYELDNQFRIKQPFSNKVSTGNTRSSKMKTESLSPGKRWSGVYSPGSTTWPKMLNNAAGMEDYGWWGRAAYPYRQSADAGQKHTVFGPYTLEPGDKLYFAIAEVVGYGAEPGKPVEGGQVARQWEPTKDWNNMPVEVEGEIMTNHYIDDYGYPDYVNSDSAITVTQVAHKAFRAYLGKEPAVPVWPEGNPPTGSYLIPVPFPAPAIGVKNTATGEISITWSRAVEAFTHDRLMGALDHFNVYRSNAGMGPWELLESIQLGAVTLDGGYEYIDADSTVKVGETRYWAVTSVDINGNESGLTNLADFEKNIGAVERLGKVYAVPNPFIEKSGFTGDGAEGRIGFYGLTAACTIRIYSYAGQLVQTIEHNDPVYTTAWLQVTRNAQSIASGVYFFVVTTPAGEQATGKFIVIK
ncbi:hypothetical protein ACFL6E_06115 [Candidatus Neomarinimicrobiota bacterium]